MTERSNPLADLPASDAEDQECVRRAKEGSREALEQLITRHQPWIDPEKLLFARARIIRVRDVARQKSADLSALDEAYGEIYRDHPFHDAPDFVASLRALIDQSDFKSLLELE